MYGTIARLTLKPGMAGAVTAWADSVGARAIPGHIETLLYTMDADPNTLMLVVLFESREAYRANAASADQHADYLTMRSFLAAEPEWNDGEAVFFWTERAGRGLRGPGAETEATAFGRNLEGTGMYGTVARLKVKPGMKALFVGWARYSSLTLRTLPGIVESIFFQMDERSQEFMMVAMFDSRDAYVANAGSSEQHEEYVHMMEFLASPPKWHDGRVIWHRWGQT